MAKKHEPGPVFTIQPLTAPKPSWWQAHRHQVLSAAALIGGFYLGSHSSDSLNSSVVEHR